LSHQFDLHTLNQQFESATPQDILRWASANFGETLAVVTSFQITGIVTLHMLQDIAPHTPVLTLDTGFIFPETHQLIDALEHRFMLNLTRVRPQQSAIEQASTYGDRLWERNPDQCCRLRKTQPLDQALRGFDGWITGLRRDQSLNRANTPIISIDSRTGRYKIAPFANWSEEMIWTYIHAYQLPYNTLHEMGYPSIGCWTCTRAVTVGDDIRSGRWTNHSKTECGIHLSHEVKQHA